MTKRPNRTTSPPRARLAFRVGVVGHRPNRLPKDQTTLDALRHMLRAVLTDVKAEVAAFASSAEAKLLYANEPPILRAASPLAEGTDRMFAEEAIDLGFELLCPMPFGKEEFENDFLPPQALEEHSVDRFRGLLKKASKTAGLTTFELDGERTAASEAYGAAGRVVLNQSDLLIAVWDGGKPAGGGGTVETLREAIQYHVPVLWIDAKDPQQWQLLHRTDELDCLETDVPCTPKAPHASDPAKAHAEINDAIHAIVADELGLPKPPPTADGVATTKTHAAEYFQERRPWFNFAFVWKLFRDFVARGAFQFQSIIVRDFETQISKAWPIRRDFDEASATPPAAGHAAPARQLPSILEDWVNSRLRPHYAWADKRGDIYADAYRSGYVLTYLLSATAVFMALLPMAAHLEGWGEIHCVSVELVILAVIVFLLIYGRRRHWHERWMEYRLLAEMIRQIRFLIPLGGGRPFPRVPVHYSAYENLDQTWMYWQMRAIARTTGIPPAKVTSDYVRDCLRYMADVVDGPNGQLNFHKTTEMRSNKIGHRLHTAATWLFVLTIVSILLHLAIGLSAMLSLPSWLPVGFPALHHNTIGRWFVLTTATLPAFGAALSAIANQGEFARLAKRAAAMGNAFERFVGQIKTLQPETDGQQAILKLSQVVPLASNIAAVMVDEVADWRVVVIEQPPRAA